MEVILVHLRNCMHDWGHWSFQAVHYCSPFKFQPFHDSSVPQWILFVGDTRLYRRHFGNPYRLCLQGKDGMMPIVAEVQSVSTCTIVLKENPQHNHFKRVNQLYLCICCAEEHPAKVMLLVHLTSLGHGEDLHYFVLWNKECLYTKHCGGIPLEFRLAPSIAS